MSRDHTHGTRWRQGAAPFSGVPEALEALGAQGASPDEIARLELRLAPLLAVPTQSPSLATQTAKTAGAWRVLPWSLGGLVIGALAWTLAQSHAATVTPRSAPVPVPAVTAPPQKANPAPVLHAVPPPSAAVDVAHPAEARPSARATPRAAAKPVPVVALRTPQGELELLQKAQSALNRSASAAITILDEHAALYPEGLFVQEREMLRIEAELTLGRRTQALQRAARFSQRFGASTYRARIEALVAKPSPATNLPPKVRELPAQEVTQ